MTDFSYQLYSSRNFPPLSETLARLGKLGYKQVEGYGALYADLADINGLQAALDQNGLSMTSGHFGLDLLETDSHRALDIADRLGVTQVYAPHLMPAERPTDAPGWRAFGARLAEAGKPFQDAGLTFGWHNHDFEFAALPDGTLPNDLMLEGNDLAFEFDVAWAFVAGQNPLDVIARYGHRIRAAHIKDRAAAGENLGEDGWADVGTGAMDWPILFAALKDAGCTTFVMEHDNPSDDARFASRSLAYMQSL